jgi:molecular chaperone HscB
VNAIGNRGPDQDLDSVPAAANVQRTPRLTDDDFTLFGLAPRQRLDRADLDMRRRELQGRVHPDRFAHDDAASQRLAMQWAVRVNQAYQRLKDPLSRAATLCELRGVAIDAERNTAMPGAFLMQQMAWREALDDAGADATAIQMLDARVADEERRMLQQLETLLDDRRDDGAAAAQVRALMFVVRFREDIARRLDALGA